VVVVEFFAKYCEPCQRTLPAAQQLHASRDDLLVIGVAEDEHPADVQEMIHRYGLTFPVVHDRANVLAGRFRVRELPVTFVADRTGTIRWVGSPDQGERDLERAVGSLP
jgi:thiol-disulfide isomerase/thioredoxin